MGVMRNRYYVIASPNKMRTFNLSMHDRHRFPLLCVAIASAHQVHVNDRFFFLFIFTIQSQFELSAFL